MSRSPERHQHRKLPLLGCWAFQLLQVLLCLFEEQGVLERIQRGSNLRGFLFFGADRQELGG